MTKSGARPLLVQLSISPENSDMLQDILETYLKRCGYRANGMKHVHPVHCTLAYCKGIEDFDTVVRDQYTPREHEEVLITIQGFVTDCYCVAFVVSIPPSLPSYPKDKNLHITMRLKGRPPVYSNHLIARLIDKMTKDESREGSSADRMVKLDDPFTISSTISVKFQN